MRRRLAFTLAELLVVIAIVAILASILFPVFAQARSAAKKAACLSNLHQVGLAIALYRNDFDGVNPRHSAGFVILRHDSGARWRRPDSLQDRDFIAIR